MHQSGDLLNNRYKVISLIGQGGMSNVYLVEDEVLKSRWALKEMLGVFTGGDKNEILEQFKKEARILAGIKHPSLPRVFDFFEEDSRYYLVMEYVEGSSMEEIISKEAPLPPDRVVKWGVQLCGVLELLHEKGIVYRDLKPGNIMVDDSDNVFLIDFGIARFFSGTKLHDTIIIGTPGFASPEHHGRSETDPRSDIYSLGATIHYLLTGIDPGLRPFIFNDVREVNPAVSKELSDGVLKAVSLDPAGRFQSARAMKEFLSGIISTDQELRETVIAPKKPERFVLKNTETFYPDPVKAYAVPFFLGAFTVGAGVLLITGGLITLEVLSLAFVATLPAAFLYDRLIGHITSSLEKITIELNADGVRIIKGSLKVTALWDEVTGLLEFKEKTKVGLIITKYKLFTLKGNFEYCTAMKDIIRLNDLIVRCARMSLISESSGYKRYGRRE